MGVRQVFRSRIRKIFVNQPKGMVQMQSSAQVSLLHHGIVEKVLGCVRQHNGTGLEHIAPVRDGQGHVGILLHHENCGPLPVHLLNQLELPVHQNRSQPHGRLVHEEDLWVGKQGPCHGEHLLLPAAENHPGLVETLPELREKLKHPFDVRPHAVGVRPQVGAHLHVLQHGEPGENPSVFRNNGDPSGNDGFGRLAVNALAREGHAAPFDSAHPKDRLQGGGLA